MAARHDRNSGSAARTLEIVAPPQISVEHPVGLGLQPAVPKIHEQKCQIVENVDTRKALAEFDRIEEGRFSVDEADVAQVQIPVAAPHEAALASAFESRSLRRQAGVRRRHEIRNLRRVEEIGIARQLGGVLRDHLRDPVATAERRCRLSAVVKPRHGIGQPVDQLGGDFMAPREFVENPVFVEPRHADDPIENLARPIPANPAVRPAHDRPRPPINRRRGSTVDADFRFAGGTASGHGGIIHVVETDGALELDRARSRKENHRAVGLDPAHRCGAVVGLGGGQEINDFGLIVDDHGEWMKRRCRVSIRPKYDTIRPASRYRSSDGPIR